MEYISFKAIIAKKKPKHFFKIFTSIFIAIFAPKIAPKTPKIEIIIATGISIFLFFKFTIIATIDVGIKNIKFVAWATCCSIPNINVRKNIKIVPPTSIVDIYEESAILLMTSIYKRLPLVLTDAMSRGCVSVAFDSFNLVHDIINSGALKAVYTGSDGENITGYQWFRCETYDGEYIEVENKAFNNNGTVITSISEDGTMLYPALDQGARQWYKVQVTFEDGTTKDCFVIYSLGNFMSGQTKERTKLPNTVKKNVKISRTVSWSRKNSKWRKAKCLNLQSSLQQTSLPT